MWRASANSICFITIAARSRVGRHSDMAAPPIPSLQLTETLLASVLLQLIIMIGAARLLNLILRRLGQPGVVGEIVAGLLLGPSLFGHFCPELSTAIFGSAPPPAI